MSRIEAFLGSSALRDSRAMDRRHDSRPGTSSHGVYHAMEEDSPLNGHLPGLSPASPSDHGLLSLDASHSELRPPSASSLFSEWLGVGMHESRGAPVSAFRVRQRCANDSSFKAKRHCEGRRRPPRCFFISPTRPIRSDSRSSSFVSTERPFRRQIRPEVSSRLLEEAISGEAAFRRQQALVETCNSRQARCLLRARGVGADGLGVPTSVCGRRRRSDVENKEN